MDADKTESEVEEMKENQITLKKATEPEANTTNVHLAGESLPNTETGAVLLFLPTFFNLPLNNLH